jgi:hypothetical protein
MIPETVKAGPVATGTDLRNAVLANGSVNSNAPPPRQADARQLARLVFSNPPSGIVCAIAKNGLPYWRPL